MTRVLPLLLLSALFLCPARAQDPPPAGPTTAPANPGADPADGAAISSATPSAPFLKGANCLFMGHSFFIPVAKRFDRLAQENGFESHQAAYVFAPGARGTPGALWRSARHQERVADLLSEGKIELLAMTAGSARSGLEDYQRWIDLALEHNPKTRFMIGLCWPPGGPQATAERYAKLLGLSEQRAFGVVKELRQANPKVEIEFVNYGLVTAGLKTRFEAGELPEIEQLVGRDPKSLFIDGLIGHGGPLLLELSALCWLQALYGGKPEELKHRELSAEARAVWREAVTGNLRYRPTTD